MQSATNQSLIDKTIEAALNCSHIISMDIEDLTKEQLIELSEKAKKHNLLVTLRAELSELHQGVLVSLISKSVASQLIMHL